MKKIPGPPTTFLPFFASYFFATFLHFRLLPSPHLSSGRLNLFCFLALSILLLSFLRALRKIAERKVELDASFTELSVETCRRFCFCWSELLQLTGSSSSKTSTVCHGQPWSLRVQSIQDNKRASLTQHTC